MKKINFYVIGGQYESSHCYGGASTLIGAKRLATKNKKILDNSQGKQKLFIYRAEETEEIESYGRITTTDGTIIRVPKYGAEPIEY